MPWRFVSGAECPPANSLARQGFRNHGAVVKSSFVSLLLPAFWLLSQHSAFADFRTWTNSTGVKIEAEFVKTEGGNVTLRMRSGKTSTFSETKLSAEDREFLKTASAAPAADDAKPAVADANRKAKWLTKMDKAKKEAEETGLPILVLFTGTEWCPYCIKLENEVFEKKDFKDFADKSLVLLKLDFPAGGEAKNKADEKLAQEFGVKGFPKYFLTDASGKPHASGGYQNGIDPEKFAAWVKSSSKAGK